MRSRVLGGAVGALIVAVAAIGPAAGSGAVGDGRQAQVEVTRAPRRQRALIGAALRAALDECATL